MKGFKKFLLLVLVTLLVFSFISCNTNTNELEKENADYTYSEVLGDGHTEFVFEVIDLEGTEKYYLIKTDAEFVGEALLNYGLIDGEMSLYGLYVKTVDNLTLDYDKDGKYWAFYIDGEYASSGVDLTEIEEGKLYTFKAE